MTENLETDLDYFIATDIKIKVLNNKLKDAKVSFEDLVKKDSLIPDTAEYQVARFSLHEIEKAIADRENKLKIDFEINKNLENTLAWIEPEDVFVRRNPDNTWDQARLSDKSIMRKYQMDKDHFNKWVQNNDNCHHVEGLIFEPPEDTTKNRLGKEFIVDSHNRKYINIYQPPATLSPHAGEWSDIDWLIQTLTNNDESAAIHFVTWLAWKIQHPGVKSMVAQVLITRQRKGKDTLKAVIETLLGPTNCGSFRGEDSFSDIGDKVFATFNEFHSRRMDNKLANKIKEMIRSSTLSSERKYEQRREVTNRLSCLFMTNDPDAFGKIESDDTRFEIHKNLDPATQDEIRRMQTFYKHGSGWSDQFMNQINHFYYDLLNLSFDNELETAATSRRGTTAHDQIVAANKDTRESFLDAMMAETFDALSERYPPKQGVHHIADYPPDKENVPKTLVYNVYKEFVDQNTPGSEKNSARFASFMEDRGFKCKPTNKGPVWTNIPRGYYQVAKEGTENAGEYVYLSSPPEPAYEIPKERPNSKVVELHSPDPIRGRNRS